MKKGSFTLILGIFTLLIVGIYTGYLFWQKSIISEDVSNVDTDLSTYQNEILKYDNKNVLEAINAKKTISEIDLESVEWSKIIKTIRSTVPEKSNLPIVDILSYSGGATNEISMNVKTVPSENNPYIDVATFISAFDKSENFTDSFVSSISNGTNDEGKNVLTFLFTTQFVPETEEIVIDSISAPNSAPKKVERGGNGDSENLDETLDEVLNESLNQ